MNMTLERFTTIIEAYGSRPESWPAEERSAAADFLLRHPQALDDRSHELDRLLDDLLDQLPVATMTLLEQRVLARAALIARGSVFDRLLEWLLPHSERLLAWLWRPALVACLPLVFGVYLGNFYSFGIDGAQNSWEEELYLLSLNDYAETLE